MKQNTIELGHKLKAWEGYFKKFKATVSPAATWYEIIMSEGNFKEFLKDIKYAAERIQTMDLEEINNSN